MFDKNDYKKISTKNSILTVTKLYSNVFQNRDYHCKLDTKLIGKIQEEILLNAGKLYETTAKEQNDFKVQSRLETSGEILGR
jgi:hypothetical protein